MRLETAMLNRSSSKRVVLEDDDERQHHGAPLQSRAGHFRCPLAWAKAAARVCWSAVAGPLRRAEPVELDADREKLETRG